MKKLVLALAVIASMSMISCTNNAENTETTTEEQPATEQVQEQKDSANVEATEVAPAENAEQTEATPEEPKAEEQKAEETK